jgi:hypothetical protein
MSDVSQKVEVSGDLPCSLSYKSMGEEENIVEPVGEHTTLFYWTDTGYSRKDKTDRVWENIGKEMTETGNIIYS